MLLCKLLICFGLNFCTLAVTTSLGIGQVYSGNGFVQLPLHLPCNLRTKPSVSKNGTWFASQDPAASSNEIVAFSSTMQDTLISPAIQTYNDTSEVAMNFGQRAFSYTPPTGYQTLCTANLPEPTITKGSDHFNTVLYTGNNADGHAITGVGFQPDLTWIFTRNNNMSRRVYDSVRGVNAALLSDTTATEDQYAGYGQFESFDSDGFTVGVGTNSDGSQGYATNTTGHTYAAYNWKESATAGFDIVGYTGTGSTPQTRSHSLGVAPEVMFVKSRSGTDGDEHWVTYHHKGNATPEDYFGRLNTTGAWEDNTIWNDTAPTSSVFTTANNAIINGNSKTFIAYLFAGVEGYSKFGCYFGNGSQDGPFIYTGFKPAWVLVKNAENSSSVWNLHDNKRNPHNIVNIVVYPNESNAEEAYSLTNAASTNKLFLSNGFKIWSTHDPELNANNERYIYMAFAERPFKYANAR